jgi:hypothetical protein
MSFLYGFIQVFQISSKEQISYYLKSDLQVRVMSKISADKLFVIANWVLIATLGIGVIATYEELIRLLAASLTVGLIAAYIINVTGKIKENTFKREMAEAYERIELLRAKNLELEKAFSPRALEQNLTSQRLKAFPDISVIIFSSPDYEHKRAAGQIRFMLAQAGWTRIFEPVPRFLVFHSGVVIHRTACCSPHMDAASNLLVSILNDNGIVARTGYPILELGPLELLVMVGPKPLPESLKLQPEDVPVDEQGTKMWGNILE